MVTQIGFLLLKVAGVSTLSLLATFTPTAALLGIVVAMIVAARVHKLYLQLRDTVDLIKFQRANKAAMAKQRAADQQTQ